jgi:hypothetical protein
MPTTADVITEITSWFQGGFDVLTGILLPTAGLTPLSGLLWFGLAGSIITFAVGFLKRLAS